MPSSASSRVPVGLLQPPVGPAESRYFCDERGVSLAVFSDCRWVGAINLEIRGHGD